APGATSDFARQRARPNPPRDAQEPWATQRPRVMPPPRPTTRPRIMSVVLSSKRGSVRTIPALTISAVLLATLTACTGGPFGASCAPLVTSGPASALVSAEGAVGSQPMVDFP